MFWKEMFLAKIRLEWLRRIAKFQYKAGDQWYDAVVTDKTIVGNTMKITTVTTDSLTMTITGIRVFDTGGDLAGEISESITKNSTQGLLTLWEFPLYEISK